MIDEGRDAAGSGLTNIALARRLLQLAGDAGVREVCVCAGSRNSPLVAVLTACARFRLYSFFDERSAAFFALGRWKVSGRPIAVVTTSGTAVAEMLPACVEAFYEGAPLLLITADRPLPYRGTGAPQTIDQKGIFGSYAEASLDINVADVPEFLHWSRSSPLHVNVAFDEPLIDGALDDDNGEWSNPPSAAVQSPTEGSVKVLQFLTSALHPLVILGSMPQEARNEVRSFVRRLSAPLHAEAVSGFREDPAVEDLVLRSGERILTGAGFDSVIRIGDIPSLRFWRDLESGLRHISVLSVNDLPFAGLSRGTHLAGDIRSLLPVESIEPRADLPLLERDRARCHGLDQIFADERDSEPSQFRQLSRIIPNGSRIFLGNSLPIREWNLAAEYRQRNHRCLANRGANGIDGELSTFLGTASPECENWAILGDLTTLYDLSAPWIIRQLDRSVKLRIVVVNNGGGRIFSRVAGLKGVDRSVREVWFENAHAVHFANWAAMWSLEFESWERVPDSLVLPDRVVIEILPDRAASASFWNRYDALGSDV